MPKATAKTLTWEQPWRVPTCADTRSNLQESDSSIMACLKHFALYGASESGRDYNRTDISRVQMFNEYLPPYKAAVEAGVGTVTTRSIQ